MIKKIVRKLILIALCSLVAFFVVELPSFSMIGIEKTKIGLFIFIMAVCFFFNFGRTR